MIFFRLILVNLLRHRIRTLVSIAGIAFSVAAMLTVVTVLQGAINMFSGILSSGAELIVFERNVSDLFFSDVPLAAFGEIAQWPMVAHADPVLFGIVSSADHPMITCFGLTAEDARIQKATLLGGDRNSFGSDDGIVLGERAADFLGTSLGREVPIGHGTFRVRGIIRTRNGFEDGGVFMPLATAQRFFHKDGLSVITIRLRNREEAGAFKSRVRTQFSNLIALDDTEFSRSYSQFKILRATAWAVGGCGLALGGLGIANTMIMSVFTRIREIAILRVNGFSSSQIAATVFGESALVSLAGSSVGIMLGSVALYILKLVPALHGYIDVTVHPALMLIVVLLALSTGLAGALYPAFYAMRIRPVEALRFE
ncbi:MAG TPA: ABC transporter permease [Terracidiphilus sp.]|jgi:putative ABC transport system permease protein|nr:ABC transporter permease [Terracidiphilus sp.]